jgi:hypothetical protein
MTLLFKELAGSPTETYGELGMTAQRRLLCAYEDRLKAVAVLLGQGGVLGGQPAAAYPGRPAACAVEVRVEPFEKRPDDQGQFDDLTADLNNYSNQFAQLIVDYEMLDSALGVKLPKVHKSTILSYRMDFGGEYIRLPGQSLQWQSGATIPVPPEVVPTLRIPVVEHHVTWHRVLDPPWDAIRSCAGAINSADFMGAAAETVLFDGAKASREFTGMDSFLAPQFGWKITYVFREKAIKVLAASGSGTTYGWNHTYRDLPAPQSCWDRLVDRCGNTLYTTVDFTPLFQFAAVAGP